MAVKYLKRGIKWLTLSPIITHHYNIDDFQQGFDVTCLGQSDKVILNWE